jgi:hypothetical protein
MSSDDRVEDVVQAWAHLPNPPIDTDLLTALWALSHGAPLQIVGTQALISALTNEFDDPPKIPITLQSADFDPGPITTVGALKTAVRQTPLPAAAPVNTALARKKTATAPRRRAPRKRP